MSNEKSAPVVQKINLPIEKQEATPTNPDFSWGLKMLAIFIWFIIIIYISFLWVSKVVLDKISLETEKKWFWNLAEWEKFDYSKYIDYEIKEFEKYNFNLSDSKEVNAYAFLWWNIVINQGFMDFIENQEELVFVMAHEMAHIKNRDVIRSISTRLQMQLILIFLGFDIWIWSSNILNIWKKYFSRNIELNADKKALEILKKYRINPLCVVPFFTREYQKTNLVMGLLSTHPLNKTRINLLKDLAEEMWFTDKKDCKKINLNY